MPEVGYSVLDRVGVGDALDELVALHAEVYGGMAGASPGSDQDRARRDLGVWARQPGFAMVTARQGSLLVGYACGHPLRPSTDFWRDPVTAIDERITEEYPGRTFAVRDILVKAPWRRGLIGSTLHDRLLAGRPEERAVIAVPPRSAPGGAAAHAALAAWGWRTVARRRAGPPRPPVLDLLLRDGRAAG